MNTQQIIIATRESPLALCQAELIRNELLNIHPHLSIKLLGITTEADKRLNISLTEIGGKGLFVKELEQALLQGRADIAVHSMKDVPMTLPQGLQLPVICKRTEPRDAFISTKYKSIDHLPPNARLGTSSLRRQTQLRSYYPHLNLTNLRGNINTRLDRLDHGDFDAIILAAAGLKRMQFEERINEYLSIEKMLPAAGQGALGIECRSNDSYVQQLIAPLNHALTYDCLIAERAMCRYLNGGCRLPIAAFAEIHLNQLTLRGLVANRDGSKVLYEEFTGVRTDAEEIGTQMAKLLLAQGAQQILQEFI